MLAAHGAFGMLPGAERPALAVTVPTQSGEAVLLDAGANVECRPDHLVQFAHLVAREHRARGREVAVYARSFAALNGRVAQELVDPEIDLTTISELADTERYVVPIREGARFRGFRFAPR